MQPAALLVNRAETEPETEQRQSQRGSRKGKKSQGTVARSYRQKEKTGKQELRNR